MKRTVKAWVTVSNSEGAIVVDGGDLRVADRAVEAAEDARYYRECTGLACHIARCAITYDDGKRPTPKRRKARRK